jgi:peroxiredoxin
MVRTASTMVGLGAMLPRFDLPDTNGQIVSSDQLITPKGLLVAFLCPHCPFVRHIRREFARAAHEFRKNGVGVVAVNANDIAAVPEDGIAGLKEEIRDAGYAFPYLVDESQDVAKAFRAACTPDFFLFDADGRLVYRGQFDDSRPKSETPVTGKDLRAAVSALIAGQPVPPEQRASIGCNIKWKAGNAPDYFGL